MFMTFIILKNIKKCFVRSADMDDISTLQNEIPFWNNGFSITDNNADKNMLFELLLKFYQGKSDKRVIFRQWKFYNIDAPIEKGLYLIGGWETQ